MKIYAVINIIRAVRQRFKDCFPKMLLLAYSQQVKNR